MIDLVNVPQTSGPPGSAGPAPGYKWNDVETLLNVIIMANSLGPSANNISVAARTILFELNESIPPAPPPGAIPLKGVI